MTPATAPSTHADPYFLGINHLDLTHDSTLVVSTRSSFCRRQTHDQTALTSAASSLRLIHRVFRVFKGGCVVR